MEQSVNLCKTADGRSQEQKPKLYLLEFDKRFSIFPEFVSYDFHSPLKLPRMCNNSPSVWYLQVLASLKGAVDHIICDPPFLSEDCQTKGMGLVEISLHIRYVLLHSFSRYELLLIAFSCSDGPMAIEVLGSAPRIRAKPRVDSKANRLHRRTHEGPSKQALQAPGNIIYIL